MQIPKKIILYSLFLFAFSLPISFVPLEFSIVFILWGWVADGMINKQWQARSHWIFLPLLFYLGWNILCSLLSGRPRHSLWAVADNEWPLFAMLFMFWTLREKNHLKKILQIFLGVTALSALVAVLQTFTGLEFHRGTTSHSVIGTLYRAGGFYDYCLAFALLASCAFFLSFSLAWEKKRTLRSIMILPALLFLLAVLFTFTRGVWLSIILIVPFLGFLKNRNIGWLILLTFVLVSGFLIMTFPIIQERAISMVVPSENQTRINLWKTSINIFVHNPVFGVGEDNFDLVLHTYLVPGYYDSTAHPHNDYLNVLVASGIPGLCAFLTLWIGTLIVGFSTWRRSTDSFIRGASLGGSLSLIGFLIASLTQNYYGTFINCWLWWFVVGIVFASYALDNEKGQNQIIV